MGSASFSVFQHDFIGDFQYVHLPPSTEVFFRWLSHQSDKQVGDLKAAHRTPTAFQQRFAKHSVISIGKFLHFSSSISINFPLSTTSKSLDLAKWLVSGSYPLKPGYVRTYPSYQPQIAPKTGLTLTLTDPIQICPAVAEVKPSFGPMCSPTFGALVLVDRRPMSSRFA